MQVRAPRPGQSLRPLSDKNFLLTSVQIKERQVQDFIKSQLVLTFRFLLLTRPLDVLCSYTENNVRSRVFHKCRFVG